MDYATYLQLGKNGRLCNCLFQIAATVAYALDNNKTYIFPEWEYNAQLERPLPTSGRALECLVVGVREKAFSYSPLPYQYGTVSLEGFFQTAKYFDHHRDLLLSLFQPNKAIRNHVRQESLLLASRCERTCSIHVRRGDYASNPGTQAYHGLLPISYYAQAIDALYPDKKDVLFVIFSDDPEWCADWLSFIPNSVIIADNSPLVDLYLMASCTDNIICNSSFSWWGSYLNKHKDKRIVAPKQWFTGDNAPKDTQDIYLPNTIII